MGSQRAKAHNDKELGTRAEGVQSTPRPLGRCPTDFAAVEALLPQLLRVPGGTRNPDVLALVGVCEELLRLKGAVADIESQLAQDQTPRMGLCRRLQETYLKILGTSAHPIGLTKARLDLAAQAVHALPPLQLAQWACGGLGVAAGTLAHVREVVNPAVKQCLTDHRSVWAEKLKETLSEPTFSHSFRERWHLLRASKRCARLEKELNNLLREFEEKRKEWEGIETQFDRVLACASALHCVLHSSTHFFKKSGYDHSVRIQKYVLLKLEKLLSKRLEKKHKECETSYSQKIKILENLKIQIDQKYSSLKGVPLWKKQASDKDKRMRIAYKWLNVFSNLEKNIAYEIDSCHEVFDRINKIYNEIINIEAIIEGHLCEGIGKTLTKGSVENLKSLKIGSQNKPLS